MSRCHASRVPITPRDTAGTGLFPASYAARDTSGQALAVDGHMESLT
jgi:hypothetical protein